MRPSGSAAFSRLYARLRSLWRGILRRDEVEADMSEEFRHHVELRTEHLIREGVAPAEASRRARLEFGHVETHRQEARASRGLRPLDELRFSWLDVKLGLRMLVRYPGLTVVGGLAMAFAIFVGAGTFELIGTMLHPTLPLPGGDRIIGIRFWDRAENQAVRPIAEEVRAWRDGMRTVRDIGAFVTAERSLGDGAEPGEPVTVALISPSGFRVAGVAPALGRALVDSDAAPGAPPVLVLGHRLWVTRFGADPAVVGRTVRLGAERTEVVGVMPERYAFPQDHDAWIPLGEGMNETAADAPLLVFGRLADGATPEAARAEASSLVTGAAGLVPERYEHLSVEVLPYAESLRRTRAGLLVTAMVHQLNVFAALFLFLVAANVALLMFARAATREREMLVRNALGASRGRILSQLFVEALVLATLASLLAVAATEPALEWIYSRLAQMAGEPLPFWYVADVSGATLLYALGLTLLGAVVAGVVPALKVTGRGMEARLRQAGTGSGGLRFGGLWTGVIVTQIAATVVFTGMAILIVRQAVRSGAAETLFPAEQYLAVRLEMDRATHGRPDADPAGAEFMRAYGARVRELERRLAGHGAVAGLTLSDRLPMKASGAARIEIEGGAQATDGDRRQRQSVSAASVASDFFDVLELPVVAGRLLGPADRGGGARTVVVNTAFVEDLLNGSPALGRRIRYLDADEPDGAGPWHEIVGVVSDFVADRPGSLDLQEYDRAARVFHLLDPEALARYPIHLVVRARRDPAALVPVVRAEAAAVDPTLRPHEPTSLDRVNRDLAIGWRLYAELILIVSGTALFLAVAGLYAVMSFTVSRRTREIGVRIALGAAAPRVVAETLRHPLVQLGGGVLLGCVLLGALAWAATQGRATTLDAALLLGFGAAMLVICGLAAVGPSLRALRVEPADALSSDA